jgi:hypothetical protein
MTYETDDDVDHEPEQAANLSAGSRRKPIAVVAALALIGVGSASIWHDYGGTFPTFAFKSNSADGSIAVGDGPVTLKDFQAFQQQITVQMQMEMQLLGSQQTEIKKLSDQAADLAAKVDALKLSSAQAAMPAPLPPAVKTKSAPRPKPANISTGGAPLPLAPKPASRR